MHKCYQTSKGHHIFRLFSENTVTRVFLFKAVQQLTGVLCKLYVILFLIILSFPYKFDIRLSVYFKIIHLQVFSHS